MNWEAVYIIHRDSGISNIAICRTNVKTAKEPKWEWGTFLTSHKQFELCRGQNKGKGKVAESPDFYFKGVDGELMGILSLFFAATDSAKGKKRLFSLQSTGRLGLFVELSNLRPSVEGANAWI